MIALAFWGVKGISAEELTVHSPAWTLAVDGKTGALVSLRDRDGYEYLTRRPTPLFRLLVTATLGQQRWLSADQAASFEGKRTEAGKRLKLHWEGIGFPDLSARATVERAGRALLFRLWLDNRAGVILEEVVFPDLPLRPTLGQDPADDCILAPWGDGVLLTRRLIDRLSWSPLRPYPGQSSMQFVAFYDQDRGLSLTCRDSAGECKSIGYEKQEGALLLRLSILRPFVKALSFAGPVYALEPCRGSWTTAAENYKTWARGQKWSWGSRRLACPEWLKTFPLFLDMDLRPLGNGRRFVPLEKAGEWADAWKEALLAPTVVVMVRSWEKEGIYVMPDCFPVYPSRSEFVAMTSDLHRRGHFVFAMVAGLKWVIQRQPYHTPHYNVTGYEGRELFEKGGRSVCAVDKSGQVVQQEPYFTWDGTKAFLCPATPYARQLYARCARELAASGVDLFEFDQMNGGGLAVPCYSTQHGHPPGYGPWVAAAIHRLFEEARRAGKAVNPHFALAMEEAGERYLDVMDTFCGRNHEIATWPAMGEGSMVVPAFSYVYHAVKPGMEIDIAHSCLEPAPGYPEDLRIEGLTATARNFIWGRMLCTQLRPWEVLSRFGEDDLLPLPHKMEASQRALLRHAGAILWGPALEFFSQGELEPLETPSGLPVWWVREKNGEEEFLQPEPAVRASSFSLKDGRRAFFFVNTASQAVEFGWPEQIRQSGLPVCLYRNGKRREEVPNPLPSSLRLAPYDVVAVILEDTHRQE